MKVSPDDEQPQISCEETVKAVLDMFKKACSITEVYEYIVLID